MPFGFYQFYMAYGGPNYDDFDFTSAFDLDDIGDGSAEFHGVLRDLARRASDSDCAVQLGCGDQRNRFLPSSFRLAILLGTSSSTVATMHCIKISPSGETSSWCDTPANWNKHFDTVEASVDWGRLGLIQVLGR